MDVLYSPVWDDDGHVGGVLVVCQETTQKVELEQRLRATAAALAQQAELLRATTLTLEQRSAEAELAAELTRESDDHSGRSAGENTLSIPFTETVKR